MSLIEREPLLVLSGNCRGYDVDSYFAGMETALDAITAAPEVNAKPIETAIWLPGKSHKKRKCSHCQKEWKRWQQFQYCPSCGAKIKR